MRKLTLAALLCAISLLLPAPAMAVTNDQLIGNWVAKTDTVTLHMSFTADGKTNASAKSGDKTSTMTGTWKIKGDTLVVSPSDSQPVTYDMQLSGDKLTLSGGDFGEGKGLVFSRVGDAPAVDVKPQPPVAPVPPAAQPDQPAHADGNSLPGGKWDTKPLEANFSIVKTKYDAENNKVTWLLERKTDTWGNYVADFYDEDDVKIATVQLEFDPPLSGVAKGERTRGSVALPKDTDLKRSVKVVVTKR